MKLDMMSFKNSANDRFLLILLSSLTLIMLFSFSSNLVQSSFADSTFTAAGDWECNSRTDATVTNMNGKNPNFAFGLGDYSYASTGSCWWNKLTPSLNSVMKIAIGNHDDDDSEGFSGYMSHFGLGQTYYKFDHEGVHVLVMDTDRVSYASGSAQRNFVINDLQQASTNPNVKWIIVYLHKPMYTSPNTCSSSSCSNTGSENTNIRNGFGPIFDQYGVDLVLQGHVHDYQRTFTLKYDPGSPSSPTITSNNPNTYTEGNGAVYAIVGTGGASFHALSGRASFTQFQTDKYNGQMQIKVTDNGNKLEGKFYKNGDNSVLDSFTITKAGNFAPVANNQVVTATKNTAKPITLTATDANNDPLTYTIVTGPAHGTISGGTGAARTYTPANNYVGPDSFTFKANDGTVDSNTATVSITVQDTATTCTTNLPISGVTANPDNGFGNVAENVLDNDLNTRWSHLGLPSFITADLGSIKNICSEDIAWYLGNERVYTFTIATSTDGTTFTNKLTNVKSSGTTLNSEKYTIPATDARYVRVTVTGNTANNNYASITEIDIFGTSASATSSSVYNYGPSLTLSGPP